MELKHIMRFHNDYLQVSRRVLPSPSNTLYIMSLGIFATTLFNYIFPPQFFIEMLSITSLILPPTALLLLMLADIPNLLILPSCVFESIHGVYCFNVGTVTQYIALSRNLMLLTIFTYLLTRIIKKNRRND